MRVRTRIVIGAGWIALAGLALLLRVRSLHQGLIYPDGYQYLLMARGIATHLTPTLQLGRGGELFVPSVDAALKPLFPAVVAALSPVAGLRTAADAITVAAGVATVLLASLIAGRLTGSRAAVAVTAAAMLSSSTLAYWSGFTGPDPLSEALALATALAVIDRRAVPAGLLGALCIASRPEWSLVLIGVAVAALARPDTRAMARTSLLAGAFVLAALIGALRPPLAAPAGGAGLLLGAVLASVVLQLTALAATTTPRRATVAASAALAVLAAFFFSGRSAAADALIHDQWPLLALAAWGLLRACIGGRARPALILLAAVLVLGATYAYRNAGSERYLAQLLPLAGIAAGLAAAPVSRREPLDRAARAPRWAAAWIQLVRLGVPAGALALGVAVAAPQPALARDTFASLAAQLAHAQAGTLVSAAPDAYGFLLPHRPEQSLRPGARGLILLDGAQRTYAPDVTARGVILARLTVPEGFERPNGTIDTGPAVLIRGMVTDTR